jgi:hypothetical protein
MSLKAPLAVAWGAALLALPAAAQAQMVGQLFANASEGATNNVFRAPDSDPMLIASDTFTSVRGGLQAGYTGRKSDQTLAYSYAGTFYATHSGADVQSHDLGWRFHVSPTGKSDLRTLADVTYSHLSTVNPLAASGAVNPQAVAGATALPVASGPASYLGLSAGTVGSYQPDGGHAWSEYTTVSQIFPESDNLAQSFSVVQDVRFERSRGRNALTLDLLVNFLDASALTPPMGMAAPAHQTGGVQFLAGWKHDFSAYTVGTAGVGALATHAFASSDTSVQPVGQASLNYQRGFAMANVSVAQTAQINPFLGQYLLTDVLSAGAYLALDRLERFHFVGFGSAQHGSVLHGESLSKAVDLLTGDVGLSYRPLQYAIVVSLDYNIEEQVGYQVAGTSFPSLHRQSGLLTVTGVWRSDTGLR